MNVHQQNVRHSGNKPEPNLFPRSQNRTKQNEHSPQNRPYQCQSDLETLERTKYQLYLIINAVKFQEDKHCNRPITHNANECSRSLCEMMKEILNRLMMNGFQNEESSCCQNCGHHQQHQKQQRAGTDSTGGSATSKPSASSADAPNAVLQASMVSSTKDWHSSITHDLRSHLIDEIVQTILPTANQSTKPDERLHDFITFTQKTEEEMYEMANSKTEYYYLLANKVYELQNRLKERRLKRKAEQLQTTQYQNGAAPAIDSGDGNNVNQQNTQMQHQMCVVPQQENEIKAKIAKRTNGQKSGDQIAAKKIVFSQKQLEDTLLPTLNEMYNMPESLDFREPVDVVALRIPDYYAVVREPMDLSTIKTKLTTGQYSDPWQYIDDVWLMFNNAWLYNKRGHYVHDCCTQLSKVFNESIDAAMQSLGYCCGQKYTYNPQLLACDGGEHCTIARNAQYRRYPKYSNDTTNQYTLFCETCFKNISGDSVTVRSNAISKTEFKKMINDTVEEPDPFPRCTECGRKQHQTCELYHESIWPEGLVCGKCLQEQTGKRRKENKYSAERLPQTKLGEHIEARVKDFLAKRKANTGKVHIRVVYSADKSVEAKPKLHGTVDEFPYRLKTILVFQEIDGTDVCIFGMYAQEYGSECPAPNTRRVYIEYLDSVHYFRPKQYRTDVYHEVLLGYMDYVKQLGYTMAHIWANPPRKGEDYIFDCHPADQKIPTPKRLQDWYKKMLERGKTYGIVSKFNNIVDQVKEDKLTSVGELPFFEASHLLKVLEKAENDRKACETSQKKTKRSNTRSKAKTQPTQPKAAEWYDTFATAMEPHKNAFFVIRLYSTESIATLPPIQDPDPYIDSEVLDSRDNFLNFTQQNRYQFSSLQHVKYSTLGILYALHHRGFLGYSCDHCKKPVQLRYNCTVCEEFDLCTICMDEIGHEHPMKKCASDLDEASYNSVQQTIQRWTESLLHAYHCQEQQCPQTKCLQLKKGLIHMDNCPQRAKGTCTICKSMLRLHMCHVKQCHDNKCRISFCSSMKAKLQQQQIALRIKQEETLTRRVEAMNSQ